MRTPFILFIINIQLNIQRFDSVDVLSLNRLNLVRFAFSVSDYEKIFLLLKQIQGTLDTRLIFLQNIIKEAARYKVQPSSSDVRALLPLP